MHAWRGGGAREERDVVHARRCHILEIGQAHISYAFGNTHTLALSLSLSLTYIGIYATLAAGAKVILNCKINCRCQSRYGCDENRALNGVTAFFARKHMHIHVCTCIRVSQVPSNIKSNKQLDICANLLWCFPQSFWAVVDMFKLLLSRSLRSFIEIVNVDLFKFYDSCSFKMSRSLWQKSYTGWSECKIRSYASLKVGVHKKSRFEEIGGTTIPNKLIDRFEANLVHKFLNSEIVEIGPHSCLLGSLRSCWLHSLYNDHISMFH